MLMERAYCIHALEMFNGRKERDGMEIDDM